MTLPRIAILLAIALGVAILTQQFSAPEDMGRNVALVIALTMSAVLAGRAIRGQFGGDFATAIRNLLIWGVIIALIVLAYQARGAFGL